ncbi:GMC oxidoreductase [Seiridium cupressi]
MAESFEFTVVGSGPAGGAVAAGLATSGKKPSVLLLKAGGSNDDHSLRVDGQRWQTLLRQGLNWGYKTVPQEHCANREIDYSRGKGLGGSSAINFGVYTVGARNDYERNGLGSQAMKLSDGTRPKRVSRHWKPLMAVSLLASMPRYAAEWEHDLPPLLDTFESVGFAINPDHNSGNPLGMSVLINTASKGVRSTSKDLLLPYPENLTVVTESPVQRLVLEGSKAVGVESNGNKYYAPNEVVLSAGALDSPKIMMHSGLGAANQLERFNIPVVRDIPLVGQGLRDHQFCPLVFTRAKGTTNRASFYGDEKVMDEALEQWEKDGTGPWAKFACETGIGFFKLDAVTSSKEFQDLPKEEQAYLQSETVPHMEVFTHFPMHWFIPNFPKESLDYNCFLAFLYNSQGRGEVTLQSSDPNVSLLFDPEFLAHAFDRRAAIESLRTVLKVVRSEEDLLKYWEQTISSSWHMTGTLKMGEKGDADAVMDPDFRVLGVQNLRVADMSAVPVLASARTQAVAYVTGIICAEKLIAEYGLA